MAELKRLVIHCTATPMGREVSGKDIRRWHTDPVSKGGRGWQQVGYADLIHLDGSVENLVPYDQDDWVDAWEVTNGVKGYNATSRHVALVGGMSRDGRRAMDTRTEAQRRSLEEYVRVFRRCHPKAQVVGHGQLCGGQKACPSFDVAAWLKACRLNK